MQNLLLALIVILVALAGYRVVDRLFATLDAAPSPANFPATTDLPYTQAASHHPAAF